MRKLSFTQLFPLFLMIAACSQPVKEMRNPQKGKLLNRISCVLKGEKQFLLDSISAPRPSYMQVIQNQDHRLLTFLNEYNSSIYFYDYLTTKFVKKINFGSETNDIIKPAGYFISGDDSLFMLDRARMDLVVFHKNKIVQRIPLKDNRLKDWPNNYPQYLLSTVNPISKISGELILIGQLFWSIPPNDITKFHFTAYIDIKRGKVKYYHTYPKEIYGNGANWEGGLFTSVFYTISPEGQLILSFPPSHSLYSANLFTNRYKSIYGGSNFANTIYSIDYSDTRETPNELSSKSYIDQNVYSAILYDSFRKLYYRFMLAGVPNSSIGNSKEKKVLSIIVMDKDFKYLGESKIGPCSEWNWKNSFVTSEGLNIEYNTPKDFNENYLTFKTFTFKKI